MLVTLRGERVRVRGMSVFQAKGTPCSHVMFAAFLLLL